MSGGEGSILNSRQGGWSLVETVVAMMVGTVALMALAGVMTSTSHVHSLTLSRMELTSIAESKLDQLRSYAANGTADTVKLGIGGSLDSNVDNRFDQVVSARGRVYYARWQVAAGLNGTRDVKLRVLSASPRRDEVPYLDFRTLILID